MKLKIQISIIVIFLLLVSSFFVEAIDLEQTVDPALANQAPQKLFVLGICNGYFAAFDGAYPEAKIKILSDRWTEIFKDRKDDNQLKKILAQTPITLEMYSKNPKFMEKQILLFLFTEKLNDGYLSQSKSVLEYEIQLQKDLLELLGIKDDVGVKKPWSSILTGSRWIGPTVIGLIILALLLLLFFALRRRKSRKNTSKASNAIASNKGINLDAAHKTVADLLDESDDTIESIEQLIDELKKTAKDKTYEHYKETIEQILEIERAIVGDIKDSTIFNSHEIHDNDKTAIIKAIKSTNEEELFRLTAHITKNEEGIEDPIKKKQVNDLYQAYWFAFRNYFQKGSTSTSKGSINAPDFKKLESGIKTKINQINKINKTLAILQKQIDEEDEITLRYNITEEITEDQIIALKEILKFLNLHAKKMSSTWKVIEKELINIYTKVHQLSSKDFSTNPSFTELNELLKEYQVLVKSIENYGISPESTKRSNLHKNEKDAIILMTSTLERVKEELHKFVEVGKEKYVGWVNEEATKTTTKEEIKITSVIDQLNALFDKIINFKKTIKSPNDVQQIYFLINPKKEKAVKFIAENLKFNKTVSSIEKALNITDEEKKANSNYRRLDAAFAIYINVYQEMMKTYIKQAGQEKTKSIALTQKTAFHKKIMEVIKSKNSNYNALWKSYISQL